MSVCAISSYTQPDLGLAGDISRHATLAMVLLLHFNKLKDMSREIQLLKSYKYKVI